MMTLTVGRLSFQVEPLAVERPGKPTETIYILTGARGARYALWRNANRPEMLFAVQAAPGKFGIPSSLKGKWFSDKNGQIEEVVWC